VVKDGSVEVTEVPRRAQACAGVVAQPQDLTLADQVPERLARHGDVAVDLNAHERLRHRGVRQCERQRPRAAPAAGVQTGVDDQADGPPGRRAEHAQPLYLIGVQVKLVGQLLGVQSPTLPMGHNVEGAEQQRQVRHQLQPGELGVMARHPFVERRRLQPPASRRPWIDLIEQVGASS
jgi:hypothetical protein